MEIHVACSTDDRYVAHSAAMIHSVLSHRGERRVIVHYLHDESVPADKLTKLEGMTAAMGGTLDSILVPPELTEGLPEWEYISRTMWFRIFLPDLLPAVARVLYLDCDCLVLKPLDELFATDLDDAYVGSVANVPPLHDLGRIASLGIDDPRDYFNSGVLLLNLDCMRRDRCAERLREFGVANKRNLVLPDQDTLNVILGERRRDLHPRWNAMTSLSEWSWSIYAYGSRAREEARDRPAIRHFEGPPILKPWHVLNEDPLRDTYFAHRAGTPWPTVRLEGRTVASQARVALRRPVRAARRAWLRIRR